MNLQKSDRRSFLRAAAASGHLGSLNVLPQAIMVLSTQAWMSYALAVPNGFIVASNLPGAVAAIAFVTTTLPLVPRESAGVRRQVQGVLVLREHRQAGRQRPARYEHRLGSLGS